jgi:hypothetical protein
LKRIIIDRDGRIISYELHSPFSYLISLADKVKNEASQEGGRSTSVTKSTPSATIVERSQLEIEQFLAMLRFETRSKLEELPGIPK